MKNENIIIALIFLAIVALFAFNFDKITGFAPKTIIAPTVKTSPSIIKPGEKINIEIKINQACVDPTFEFYPVREDSRGATIIGTRKATKFYSPDIGDCKRISTKGAKIPCGSSKYCKDDLKNNKIKTTFKTYSDWSGNYILRVYYWDEGKKEFIDSQFKIVS